MEYCFWGPKFQAQSDSVKPQAPDLDRMLQTIACVLSPVPNLPLKCYRLCLDQWFSTESDFISQEAFSNVGGLLIVTPGKGAPASVGEARDVPKSSVMYKGNPPSLAPNKELLNPKGQLCQEVKLWPKPLLGDFLISDALVFICSSVGFCPEQGHEMWEK